MISALTAQLGKVSQEVHLSDGGIITATRIEFSFTSFIRFDRTVVSVQPRKGGFLCVAEVNYRPAFVFWWILILSIPTLVAWLVPITFYLMQKETVRSAIKAVFERVRNEFEVIGQSTHRSNQSEASDNKSQDSYDADFTRLLKERKARVDALADKGAITLRFSALHHKWLDEGQEIKSIVREGSVSADVFEFAADFGELSFLLQKLPQEDPIVKASLADCEGSYEKVMTMVAIARCPDCADACEVLGLTPDAQPSDIERAYQGLVKVRNSDNRLTARGQKEVQKVQAAYDHITVHTAAFFDARSDASEG
jgi:DnaJ-domain-containing protein 1